MRGPLIFATSLVAEHKLQTRRLSSCGSRAQLLRSMWDPPRPGLEPVFPALAGRFSTTAPPGKPKEAIFKVCLPLFPDLRELQEDSETLTRSRREAGPTWASRRCGQGARALLRPPQGAALSPRRPAPQAMAATLRAKNWGDPCSPVTEGTSWKAFSEQHVSTPGRDSATIGPALISGSKQFFGPVLNSKAYTYPCLSGKMPPDSEQLTYELSF